MKILFDQNVVLSKKKESLLRRLMEFTLDSSRIEGIVISEEKAFQMALRIADQVEKEHQVISMKRD